MIDSGPAHGYNVAMRFRLRTLLIGPTVACTLAAVVGLGYRVMEDTHRAIHPEHFDENGRRISHSKGY